MPPTGPTALWPNIIDRHINDFKSGEKRAWDRNLRTVNGDFWAATTVGASEAALIKTSTNFMLPLVETSTANLLAPNPQVTLNARAMASKDQVEQGQTITNYGLQAGKWRKELGTTIYHVILYGRGPVKTVFDFERDLAVTRFVDPRNYFFDKTAQRFEDMKYEIEATLLSRRTMERKVEEKVYPSWALSKSSAEQYPTWMIPGDKREVNELRNYQQWFLVYEVYDREAGVVFHYLPFDPKPILEDELIFRPYDLLTFTYNGENCGGVSEVGLLMPNQEEYNWTETFLLNNLRANAGGVTYYDGRITSTDKQAKQITAPIGSRVPVNVPGGSTLQDCFYVPPVPMVPPLAQEMLGRKREGMAYVSALSDSQRGQTIGAKTATEMEWIKQQIRDRLGPRLSDIDDLTTAVATKQFFLNQRYMRNEKVVQLLGEKEWRTVNPFTLEGIEATFDIVPYSPLKNNKAVRLEALRSLVPLMENNPYIKQRALWAQVFEDIEMGAAEDLLYTDEEVAARAQPPPMPGAPPEGAPPNAATPLAPDAAPAEPGGMPPGGPQP